MKRTLCLLFVSVFLVFIAGCIDGQALVTLNPDNTGLVTFECLFDYPLYKSISHCDNFSAEAFFLEQLEQMMAQSGFAAWRDVSWKVLKDQRCYFKGAALFEDISKAKFFAGATASNLKLIYDDSSENSTLTLKYMPNLNRPDRLPQMPIKFFESLNLNLVVNLPGIVGIGADRRFDALDSRSVGYLIGGADWIEKLKAESVKIVFLADGRQFFDYRATLRNSRIEYDKILKKISSRRMVLEKDAATAAIEASLQAGPAQQLQTGFAAERNGDFERALKFYEKIIADSDIAAQYRARASYQKGATLLKIGRKDEAIIHLESVLSDYPMQRVAALKALKLLKDIHAGYLYQNRSEQLSRQPLVLAVEPEMFNNFVRPDVNEIAITFSESMKETDWFYSSFESALLPDANGIGSFDDSGTRWKLPVALSAGKVYAIGINYSSSIDKSAGSRAGFKSRSGLMCEPFVLVFATADGNEPTVIDEKITEKAEMINLEN